MKYLLFPFSVIYDWITSFRNFLFDNNFWIFKSQKFEEVFTISVGNLSMGGTGKTPMIEYLANLLISNYKVSTLSRGYGRKTKGIRIANEADTYETVGDEPMQFFYKFQNKIEVVVGEQRAIAIPHILQKKPEMQIILLDDAFQHRTVSPHINILLTDYNHLFFKDHIFPMGRLRENKKGVQRADIVIVTKCPEEIGYHKEYIKRKLAAYINKPKVNLFFTTIKYENEVPIFEKSINTKYDDIIVVTAIANNKSMINYLNTKYRVKEVVTFPDHHAFTEKDFYKVKKAFESLSGTPAIIVTTEKDMVKFKSNKNSELWAQLPMYYLPIQTRFLEHGDVFNRLVHQQISDFYNQQKN
ncbi:MAG: tetraacyldisaccharide 4'-kinase [Bacteroidota bacterium]|nr:tetraacyldisaccharide 4'-kinase [Bacteroidota bacterium]